MLVLAVARSRCAAPLCLQEGHLDFTGAQMVLTLKLIAVAVRRVFCVSTPAAVDNVQWVSGGCRCCLVYPAAYYPHTKSCPTHPLPPSPPVCSYQDGNRPAERLSQYAARKQLPRLPSLLQFYSYLFAAGNLLAGPHIEAADWFDYMDRKVGLAGWWGGVG